MSTDILRQYVRYEINLIATLLINNTSSIQCLISDFCSKGLFLELQQHNTNEILISHQIVQILFSVSHGNSFEDFKVDVEIMNIRKNGLGVCFKTNSDAIFEALKKESKDTFKVSSAEKRSNPVDLSKQKHLEADFLSLLREVLPIIIRSFQQHTEEELSKVANEVKDIEFNTALLETITNLSINQNAIFENFRNVTEETGLTTLPISVQNKEDITEPSLSLIGKKDFEDWLDLSTIIRNLESIYENQLNQLQKKIAYIVGVNRKEAINPANPEKICNKFRDSLIPINVNPKVKLTLYNILEAVLIEFLPDVYKKMDAILLGHGAPEKIIGNPTRRQNINKGTDKKEGKSWQSRAEDLVSTTHDASEEIITNFLPESGQSTGSYQPIISEPHVALNQNDVSPDFQSAKTSTDLTPGTGQAIVSDLPVVSVSNSDLPVVSVSNNVSNKKAKPVINVARNLLNLIKGQDVLQHQTENKATVSQEYSTEEICLALTDLHKNLTSGNFLTSSPQVLEKELSDTLSSSSSSEKKLSITDQNNIEVYENLFEILFSELILNQEIQSYFHRIYLPVMGQAILDPSFLESSNHPARNIVNHLSWLEPAVKDNKIFNHVHVRETLDQLMTEIANDSSGNSDTFVSVEQQLKEITESFNKSVEHNIKRVTEVYESKQKLIIAKQFVQEELNRRFSNKEMPRIIVTLLDAGWQHLLVMAKLNEDNSAYQSFLRIIINLKGWLSGPEKASKEQAQITLEFIDKQLHSVCTNSFLHSKIIQELAAILQENNILSDSDAMQMVAIKTQTNTKKGANYKDPFDQVDQLSTGEWMTFMREQKSEPLKLIWIGEILDKFIFVDRNGINKLELEYGELVDLIKSGAASKIESLDLPIMDRAINLMMQNMHKKVLNKATLDSVTQLLNRKEFINQLKQELSKISHVQRLLCNIEIQDFRIITNACGLSGGDAILKQLADLLKKQLDEEEIIARLDDKTFSILIKNYTTETSEKIVKEIQSNLIASPFECQDKSFSIAIGIGIVPLYPDFDYNIDSILKNADAATLSAVNSGRNRIQIYQEDDDTLKSQFNEFEWVGRINQVFADNRLFLRCQKISAIDPETNSHTHYEILLGVKDENGNFIPPDDFIPAVERCQRMSEVDRWVVQTVFSWIEEHLFDFEILDGFSINLSGESMNSEEFLEFLKQTLTTSNVPLEKITFEITETVAVGNFQFIQSFIKQIRTFNCKFSLDDFGSGYSSYAYLKSLDVDYLKIDGIFVKDILNNDADVAIVKSMNEIAHSLGLETIAEYVENDEILALLGEIGVDYAQGWGIHKPMPLTDLG